LEWLRQNLWNAIWTCWKMWKGSMHFGIGLRRKIGNKIIIIIIISCHRFSFFPGTSPLEQVVNPTTQASSLSL
jgi:hypothetical protein